MFQAILAVVGAIVGVVGGVVSANKASYAQKQAEYQANKDFARGKEMAWYNAYGQQQTTIAIIMVAGVVGIALLVYLNKKK